VAVWPEQGPARYKPVINTFGMLRGAVHPEELVIIGAHRDAWSPGALDDVSGTVSVLEAARAWGVAAAAGMRPARTLIFATWDAEEWGLIGSTEWVEANADTLHARAVAYINQDVVAGGPSFGASGTASLQALVRDVTRQVGQPRDSVTVYRDWERRTTTTARPEPLLGDLGGGSDFMGFYNHLGVPAIAFGFGGPGGSYHSGYDTWSFVERFADPGYQAHAAAGQIAALLLARLANAEVVPFEYGDLGDYLVALVDRTRREPGAEAIGAALDDLASAAGVMASLGRRFSIARNAALQRGHPPDAYTPANARLRTVERALTDPAGLPGRAFFRNLVFASDRDNGYANVQFPTVVEALRDRDAARAGAAARDLAGRVREAAARLEAAREMLPMDPP
jgi:N-acetylated-alpha-linked acidic dipeptidase